MKKKLLLFMIILFFGSLDSVYALTGIVNVNDSLTLRDQPSSSGRKLLDLFNNTELEILNTNAGTGNGCENNWYQVKYNNYTGYSCSTFINLKNVSTNNYDDSYSRSNYNNPKGKDGTIMCYEDTGSLSLRDSAEGNKKSNKVDCGQEVKILSTVEKSNSKTCKYWYQIDTGSANGYVCGYFVNTTKLSSTAQKYYDNQTNGDTINSYQEVLKSAGFPSSYFPYLLEIHARHPKWKFVSEKINLKFDDVVNGESGNGASLLQKAAPFDEGYLSLESHTYNVLTDTFQQYPSEPGYYNASKEAIAYYLDPRNYMNEKYIFTFETLGFSENQNENVVEAILKNQTFWPTVYNYYNKPGAIKDTTGNRNSDVVKACREEGISSVHVATRIKQEVSGVSTSDSRLGGTFQYNGANYSNYYNFFNIKSNCSNCSSIYAGYAKEKDWNTPFKGIKGGANFLAKNYIKLNQDTLYYEKFDVSTNDGNYTHQYMQNIAATTQEAGQKFTGYLDSLESYLNTKITFVIPVYDEMPNYVVTAPTLGNPNNYLKDLKVNGSTVNNFNYSTYNYNIYLPSNVTSVNIDATTINGNARTTGTGKINITSNNQTNQIIVTAQNGKSRKYTVNFSRQSSDPITVKEIMDHSGFKYNDNYIFGIEVGTNVSNLIGNIVSYNNSATVSIKSSTGASKTNDILKTGDKVTVTGKDGSKTYTVVIYGDTNGDGKISAVDYMKIKNHILKTSTMSSEYLIAADTNKDNNITAVDYMKVKNHILGNSKIEQ